VASALPADAKARTYVADCGRRHRSAVLQQDPVTNQISQR
jgi:hypothetical protein